MALRLPAVVLPTRCGWQEFFGSFGPGNDYFSKYNTNGEVDIYENEVQVESLDYYTDTLADRATAFIRRQHQAPWLLNLNFSSPHWPWEGPDDIAVSQELTARVKAGEVWALSHIDGGSLDTYRRMVESLDAAVGRVLDALRGTGQERDTFVLFKSDNGGERFSYVWPLSGAKMDLLEGGIRVPTLLRWPGRIRPRQVSDVPVMTQDWTATMLALGGARPKATHPLDGVDLTAHLRDGAPPPTRDMFWRTRTQAALRRDRWKFLRNETGEHLYDLGTDQHEQADLAAKYPDLTATLKARWAEIDKDLLPYPSA
ncbi:hypothetical protein GCM10029964_078000 [Kibdelosporangium lantanae]